MPIPWDKIPWDKLFAFAEKMLAKCESAGVPAEEQVSQLRNPSPRFRMKAERMVKRNAGMTEREWRKQKDGIMARVYEEARDMDNAEIKELRSRAALRMKDGDLDDDD